MCMRMCICICICTCKHVYLLKGKDAQRGTQKSCMFPKMKSSALKPLLRASEGRNTDAAPRGEKVNKPRFGCGWLQEEEYAQQAKSAQTRGMVRSF